MLETGPLDPETSGLIMRPLQCLYNQAVLLTNAISSSRIVQTEYVTLQYLDSSSCLCLTWIRNGTHTWSCLRYWHTLADNHDCGLCTRQDLNVKENLLKMDYELLFQELRDILQFSSFRFARWLPKRFLRVLFLSQTIFNVVSTFCSTNARDY